MYPPNAKLARVLDAAIEPLTLAEMKNYLRIDEVDTGSHDDLFIADAIVAARLACENINDRSFINTTWKLTLDHLPFSASGGLIGTALFGFSATGRPTEDGSILLPMPPLVSVEAIAYLDSAGVSRSLDLSPSANQVIVSTGTPGRIAPGYGSFFPFSRPTIAAVEITYTAGYGPLAADVPASVRMAIRLLVSHYYEHRTTDAPIPQAVAHLLDASRWGRYA